MKRDRLLWRGFGAALSLAALVTRAPAGADEATPDRLLPPVVSSKRLIGMVDTSGSKFRCGRERCSPCVFAKRAVNPMSVPVSHVTYRPAR